MKTCSIVIYNDDNTTYEYVLHILQHVFNYSYDTAFSILYDIEIDGKAFIKTESFYKIYLYKLKIKLINMFNYRINNFINIKFERISSTNNVNIYAKDTNC